MSGSNITIMIYILLKTGDRISVVGHNGCGKTTLINLLLRIYDPTKGEILLDGTNIKEYNIIEYWKTFCEISQDYTKYAMPLNECIGFGSLENYEDEKKVKSAATRATANEFIEKLSKGYRTNLTKRFDNKGAELSGGQWQKLYIARVFFADADILIFDEPTSALDPKSEAKIYEEIEKEDKNKLKIFISHRMYSSKNSTKIIMMANGEIVEIGTHKELMAKSKDYRKIFNLQATKYIKN